MLLLSHDLYYSLKVEKPLHRFWTLLAHTLSPDTIQLTLLSTESAETDKVELKLTCPASMLTKAQHRVDLPYPEVLTSSTRCKKDLLISSNLTYPTVLVFLTLMDSISHNCILVRV